MSKNLIKDIAKLLDIEIGTEFYVKHKDGRKAKYRFVCDDIEVYEAVADKWTVGSFILPQLVLGMVDIEPVSLPQKKTLITIKRRYVSDGCDCWGREETTTVYDIYKNHKFIESSSSNPEEFIIKLLGKDSIEIINIE